MNRRILAISLVLSASAACSGHPLSASDYDKSCKVDTDCIDVFIGDACDACRCSNDAINISEQEHYQKDLDAAANCHGGGPVCDADCIFKPPVCQQGTCILPK